MRQIFQMLVDLAHELNKESAPTPEALNAKVNPIKEAYGTIDRWLSNPSGSSFSDQKVVGEAMVIADFPLYFGTAISRAFLADYPMRIGPWRDFTYPDETPDFRPVDRLRTTEMATLVKRSELGQAKQTHVDETQIHYSVEEYARGFTISWRTIINDDMGEIKRFPQKLVRSAIRFENSFVSNLYDNATTQAALLALGTGYCQNLALTIPNLKAAYEAFLGRKDSQGNPIDVTPKFLVTSPIHELTVKEILAGFDSTANNPNPRITKDLLEWRPDPYIGDTADWYLFADPNDIPAVTVARLRGYDRPQIYLKAPNMVPFNGASLGTPSWLTGNFENGEIEFQILDIIGGWDDATYKGVTDYQGIFFSSGG